jgi:hypothetical protein
VLTRTLASKEDNYNKGPEKAAYVEELLNFNISPNFIKLVKSKSI